MKKTKIVSTLGPSSWDSDIFKELVKEGLNVARLNFSHGDHERHYQTVQMIKSVRSELKLPISIMLDTKGPEIRTGTFKDKSVNLNEGDTFILTSRDVEGDEDKCSISYEGLYEDVDVDSRILIDDGLIELKVVELKGGTDIVCEVMNGGVISNYKGVNVPGVDLRLPSLTERDEADIKFGIENDVDFIAVSFIRSASDVLSVRKVLEDNGGENIAIISKIETASGVEKIDEIINMSDGIMVARGDLGVEIPIESVPVVQKSIIQKCNKAQKPVITATQMLDSMIRNPRPTRAEATDIANAIYDGTDAIMLSGETASGKYPIEAVKTMAKIALKAEENYKYDRYLNYGVEQLKKDVTFAVSHATVTTARDLNASAILTATSSGFTAQKISALRPKSCILAACKKNSVRRKLSLYWGVETIDILNHDSIEQIFTDTLDKSKEIGVVKAGDMVVFTAGVPVGVAGATNLMRVHLVGDMLIKAIGIGDRVVSGKVKFVKNINEIDNLVDEGDILVCAMTDKSSVNALEKISSMIVVEGGFTSHAAITAINMKIPAVVGAKDAFNVLTDGQIVTVDSKKGIVYAGKTRVL